MSAAATVPATCKGSGRIVSKATAKQSICGPRGWLVRCPACGTAQTFTLAEARKDNRGYVRRITAHPAVSVSTAGVAK